MDGQFSARVAARQLQALSQNQDGCHPCSYGGMHGMPALNWSDESSTHAVLKTASISHTVPLKRGGLIKKKSYIIMFA